MSLTSPKTRFFLVGCPRSGTTLLQSLLAAHPEVCSFPESHFFLTLVPNRKILRQLDLHVRNVKPCLEQFLNSIHRPDLISQMPKFSLFNYQYAHQFISILDQIANDQNKSIWIEKTPGHLHYIDYLEKLNIEAKFIHILRNGTDVIASFYELAQQYPQNWGTGWTLERCVDRWLNDIQISLSYRNKPNHKIVRYEQLVDQTEAILIELSQFMQIEFDPQMLQGYNTVAQQVSLAHEPWKKAVRKKIQNTNSRKFYQVFNEQQQQYICERIATTKLDTFAYSNRS